MSNNSEKNNEKISIEKTDKDKLKTKKVYSKKKKNDEVIIPVNTFIEIGRASCRERV